MISIAFRRAASLKAAAMAFSVPPTVAMSRRSEARFLDNFHPYALGDMPSKSALAVPGGPKQESDHLREGPDVPSPDG